MKIYEGKLIGKGKTFGIVISRFNDFITRRLLEGAIDTLKRHDVSENDIDIVWVPGSFEIPYAASKLVSGKSKYDAVICLGAVIKGATPHNEYIASETTKGIAQAGLKSGIPVIFGVITSDSIEQAIERAGTKEGNKGSDAALHALEMANLFSSMR